MDNVYSKKLKKSKLKVLRYVIILGVFIFLLIYLFKLIFSLTL